jgi:long-chain acyl-CoA synthetase
MYGVQESGRYEAGGRSGVFSGTQAFRTLPELFLRATGAYNRGDALNWPQGGGWLSFSHAELREGVKRIALGLVAAGLGKGQSVGLIAQPSPFWVMVDYAIQIAQGVSVPLFKRISPESLVHEVRDSGMRYLFVGNPEEMPMVFEHVAGRVPLISFWYSGPHEAFDRLLESGRELEGRQPELFEQLCRSVGEEDLATIIYTSGTTARPKGVELTQRSIVSQVRGCERVLVPDPQADVALSALPLDHIFERMVMYFYFASGIPVYFVDEPKKVADYLRAVGPTIMTVVPRILEKVAARMKETARETRGVKGWLVRAAVRRAQKRQIDAPPRGPLDALFARLVYPRFREALGGRLRMVVCGSAKLHPEVARLLINLGIPIYEGYGLTEAAPVISVNAVGRRRLGTVGQAFPEVEIRIAADGEILARGPNLMRAYHNNPQSTAEAISADGWLRTGDLGSLDADGYLSVVGRKKEMFKKSTGEYVPPVTVEYALSQIPYVDGAMIVADGRTCVVALLFPDLQKLGELKERFGLADLGDQEFLASDFLRRHTQEHIDRINAHLHHCERVERFVILDHPVTVETGEFTQTLKPRRFVIEKKYHELIEQMYRSVGGWK